MKPSIVASNQFSTPGLSQAPIPIRLDAAQVHIPLFVEKVSAGFPSPAADYMEQDFNIDEFLVRNRAASFCFAVHGCSMRDAGILDGDRVLVDRSITCRHNDIVVAVLHGEFTIKRLYSRDGVTELRPENPNFKPIRITEEGDLIIWGVVVGVFRKIQA